MERPSVKSYMDQCAAMKGNLDAAVIEWAKAHAPEATMGAVVELSERVQNIAHGTARDIFETGINAKAIDEYAATKAA